MFNFLKKKEDGEQNQPLNSTNVTLENLNTSFIFDYELSTWEIIETDEYEWDSGPKTKKLKIKNAYETVFLLLEKDTNVVLKVMEKIEIGTLSPELKSHIQKSESQIQSFQYQNENFVFKSEQIGTFKPFTDNIEKKVTKWVYSSSKETIVELEQVEESNIHALIGREIPAHLITNIVKSNS